MQIVSEKEEKLFSISTAEVEPKKIKAVSSKLARKILKQLAKCPSYPLKIAKTLGVHEQKIYYHMRNLEKFGFIRKIRQETKQGVLTNYFELVKESFFVRFNDFKQAHNIGTSTKYKDFFTPFIENGKLNATIVLGSPETHGPEKAKARDGFYGMNFTLFLGTFLNHLPTHSVKLDTEVTKDDLKNNLIIIGGPVVNKVANSVNKNLPIHFDPKNKWAIKSKVSKKSYPADECGLIIKTKNPFAKQKQVLVIGGKRFAGTRAAITAFLHNFDRIVEGNLHNKNIYGNVVEAIDADSDGKIDSVEFKE